MTGLDWIAAGVIALAALNGLRRGIVGSALSLAGTLAPSSHRSSSPGAIRRTRRWSRSAAP
jgi:hypothetical protein